MKINHLEANNLSARQISIIGGSISGLGTVLEILKKDNSLDVTIYEKNSTCKEYTCAGGVSSFMLKKLKMNIPDYTVASKVTSLRIFSVEHILERSFQVDTYP